MTGVGACPIIGEGYAPKAGRMAPEGPGGRKPGTRAGVEGAPPGDTAVCVDVEVDAEAETEDEGAGFGGAGDGVGTCWNARVTSCSDIRGCGAAGALAIVGGGVSPSSDLTSCSVKLTTGMSMSAIPLSELTAGTSDFSGGCCHKSLRCSGSGARTGDSLTEKFFGQVDDGGVSGAWSD